MTTTITQTVTQTVTLSPLLQRRLQLVLAQYATRKQQIDALEAQQNAAKADIETMFAKAKQEHALAAGINLNGFHVKRHEGERNSRLDKKRLMELTGATMADFEAATKVTPKKAYTVIRTPGERGSTEEHE